MIIKDKDQEVLEIEMIHRVYIGKTNALFNFKQYLNQLMLEFERELTKKVMNIPTNPTDSHIIVP